MARERVETTLAEKIAEVRTAIKDIENALLTQNFTVLATRKRKDDLRILRQRLKRLLLLRPVS